MTTERKFDRSNPPFLKIGTDECPIHFVPTRQQDWASFYVPLSTTAPLHTPSCALWL